VSEAHPAGVEVVTLPTHGKTKCTCVRWHRPVVAEDEGHHPIPTGEPFGGDKHQALLFLCPTAHSAVHMCIRVHLKARSQGRTPTRLELAPFNRFTKRLAKLAMDALPPLEGAGRQR
jgi:hypothetical protein